MSMFHRLVEDEKAKRLAEEQELAKKRMEERSKKTEHPAGIVPSHSAPDRRGGTQGETQDEDTEPYVPGYSEEAKIKTPVTMRFQLSDFDYNRFSKGVAWDVTLRRLGILSGVRMSKEPNNTIFLESTVPGKGIPKVLIEELQGLNAEVAKNPGVYRER